MKSRQKRSDRFPDVRLGLIAGSVLVLLPTILSARPSIDWTTCIITDCRTVPHGVDETQSNYAGVSSLFGPVDQQLGLLTTPDPAAIPPELRSASSKNMPIWISLLAGLGGGVVGAVGGAYLGYAVENEITNPECESIDAYDCTNGAFVGLALGQTAGVSLGVHLGNGRRGNLGFDLLASTGAATVGLVGASVSNTSPEVFWLAISILQLGGTTLVEHVAGR